jgi:hypothetical protein
MSIEKFMFRYLVLARCAATHRRDTTARWRGATTPAGVCSEAAGSRGGRCKCAYSPGPSNVGTRVDSGTCPTGQCGGSGSVDMGADDLATGASGWRLGTVQHGRGGGDGTAPAGLSISWCRETGSAMGGDSHMFMTLLHSYKPR